MKRSEINIKDTWDLSAIVKNDEAWEELMIELCEKIKLIPTFKGKLNDKKKLLECLKLGDEIGIAIERVYCYARMKKDENSADNKYVSMANRAESIYIDYGTASSYIESELSSMDEAYLLNVINDNEFRNYDFMLKEIIRQRKHILSEKEEKLLAMAQSATGNYQEVFSMLDYVELPLPIINVKGEKKKLTLGSYSKYMEDRDPKLRKTAFGGLYGAYKKVINTLAANYAGSIKSDNFYAKARGFNSCIEKSLFIDNIPSAVYDNLIKHVSKNMKHLHDYIGLRKKVLDVKTLHMYDLAVPIVSEYKMNLSYEDAYKVVMDGLKPLGAEYAELLRKARDDRWIDVYETENKRAGAYSWGAYGSHPYILLNYSGTAHDIFTTAHELGHAMHSHYSDSNLPFSKAAYKIFVAEVASTVNETLLIKDLLSKADSSEMRKFLLTYYLDMFRTTIFRQTMFAEYEKIVHEMDQRGEPLTVASFSDAYYKLNKKYYGKHVKHDEDIKYEWSRIPHFYNSFYVYKYATGLTSAIYIAVNILKDSEYLKKYKTFLSSGGSKSPYEILKDTGVDLASGEPYEVAMKEFSDTLAQLKKEFGL